MVRRTRITRARAQPILTGARRLDSTNWAVRDSRSMLDPQHRVFQRLYDDFPVPRGNEAHRAGRKDDIFGTPFLG